MNPTHAYWELKALEKVKYQELEYDPPELGDEWEPDPSEGDFR